MIDPQPCGSEAAPLVGPGIAAPALQGPVLSAHTAFSAPASCRVVGIGAVLLALVLLHVLSLDRAAPSVAAPGVRAAQPRRAWAAGDAEWVVPVVAVDKGGHSYWTSMTIPLGPSGGPNSIGALSDVIKVTGMVVRDTAGDYDFDWHPSPARQFVVNLDGPVRIEVSDGTSKVLEAGEMFLLEDTWGHGHKSTAVHGQPRRSLFIRVGDAA